MQIRLISGGAFLAVFKGTLWEMSLLTDSDFIDMIIVSRMGDN